MRPFSSTSHRPFLLGDFRAHRKAPKKAEPSRVAHRSAERVREVCARLGRSHAELQREAGVSEKALRRLLDGSVEPRAETLERIHAVLDRWEASKEAVHAV
ncbi:MAG: helix-turn-helix transcriptional regulator [Polyangia bacterium]